MSLPDLVSGFVFLAWVTGIGGFVSLVATCIAISEREDFARFLVVLTVILALAFLTSGFFAASMR